MRRHRRPRATDLAVGLAAVVAAVTLACAPTDTTSTGPDSSEPTTTAPDTTAGTDPAPDSTDTPPSTTPAPATPVEVATTALDLVDPSRPTPAGATTPPADARTLTTTVWYPAPEADGGPPAASRFPLIVFAHGMSGHPDKFSELFETWARAGYVVAAPAFPLTNAEVPNSRANFADVANQPDDLRFVTDHLLDLATDPVSNDDPIGSRVDPELLGVGGLSLGGATTYLAALNEASRDPRVDAAMVLAGVAANDPETGTFLEPSGVPALIMHGDADLAAPLAVAENAWALLAPPKYLVVLAGAGHAEPFEDAPTPYDEFAEQYTTTFWDAWLRDEDIAKDELVTLAEAEATATLTFELR